MKQWFKMRLTWGKSIRKLSDAEAGRFIKAIYDFELDATETDSSGKEGILLATALDQLQEDALIDADISMKRSAAGSSGGSAKAGRTDRRKIVAIDSNCQQMLAIDSNCYIKNQIKKDINTDDDDEQGRARASQIMSVYLSAFGKRPSASEAAAILTIERSMHLDTDLTDTLLIAAANANARNVVAYLRKCAANCADAYITTAADYEEDQYLRDVLAGKYNPEQLTENDVIKRLDDAYARRKAEAQ